MFNAIVTALTCTKAAIEIMVNRIKEHCVVVDEYRRLENMVH